MYDELVKRLRHSANIAERGLITPPSELCAAADAIEELTDLSRRQEVELVELTGELASKLRWIPVTERLPEAGEHVLCYCWGNIYGLMKMRTDGDWVYDVHHIYMHSFVTHWMPLPKGPEEE